VAGGDERHDLPREKGKKGRELHFDAGGGGEQTATGRSALFDVKAA